MEKIILKVSARHCFNMLSWLVVTLEMDDNGKQYSIRKECRFKELFENIPRDEVEMSELPKRVLTAFTENAINKILSKDEIPNESGMSVLDGHTYWITITKGDLTKEYYADDAIIETYPILRYLANWFRKQDYSHYQ